MKKIWIALVVVAMLALLCTLGMITVFAEEGEQAACAHESVQALYNNDEHWTVCASCGVEISRQAHEFKLGKLDDGRHAIACECGRVLPDSVEAHDWVQGEDSHLSCAVCNATTDSCVYDQVTYYNDAYHTYACLCGQVNSELEVHAVDMTELQHNDEAHWHGCPCGYGARDVSEHTWGEAWVTNTTHHWKECADCGEKKDLTAHSGGTATCQVDAECAECGSSYEADTYTHVSDALVYSWNNTHHSATYACCGEVAVALESHNWDNSVCADCGYECNHDVVINGAVFNYVSTGNDKHIVVCRNCRVQEEKDCHGGEATCIAKAVCDDCKAEYGEKDPTNHVGAVTWAGDATKHWKVCTTEGESTGCGSIVEDTTADHNWSDGQCSDCQYTCAHPDASKKLTPDDEKTHHEFCDICKKVLQSALTHTWDAEGKCTDCQYQCAHQADEQTTWMKWSNAGNEHKYTCENCGWEDTKKAGYCSDGQEGASATCMAKAVCLTCKLEYGEKDLTNHVDTNTWVTDPNGHKKVCTENGCGQEIADTEGAHDWKNKDGVCDICKYECKVTPTGKPLEGGLTHTVYCDTCGKVTVESEAHKWDANGKCTDCEYQCLHAQYEKVSNDASTHDERCVVCHYVKTNDEAHTWDVKTGICTGCNYQCAHQADEQTTWMKWSNVDNVHKHTCEKCGWQDETKEGNCTGGTATCVAKAKCETCNLEYGNINSTNHADETWVIDADGHSAICDTTKNGCGTTLVVKEGHVWVDGVCSNENCQYGCLHNGTTTAVVNEDLGSHDVTCDICKKLIVDDGAHSWENGVCTVCGYICMSPNWIVIDDETENNMHTKRCQTCGYEITVNCFGGQATCSAKAKCEACQAEYGELDADNHAADCVKTVKPITNDTNYHNVYYTCRKDEDGNLIPTKEEHFVDPTTNECECGWHVTVTTGQETATVNEQKEQPVNEE